MKKVIILLIILLTAATIALLWRNSKPKPQLIGGQTDERGCLIAAGYSWNEARQQCVRSWEVPTMVEAESAVKIQLAQKYHKELSSISVKATKIDGGYVAGNVSFASAGAGEGGMFLAYKTDNAWQLVYDGNGSVDCQKMREQYGFSELVLKPEFCN